MSRKKDKEPSAGTLVPCKHCYAPLGPQDRKEQDANGDWFCAECAYWLKYASERRRRP